MSIFRAYLILYDTFLCLGNDEAIQVEGVARFQGSYSILHFGEKAKAPGLVPRKFAWLACRQSQTLPHLVKRRSFTFHEVKRGLKANFAMM